MIKHKRLGHYRQKFKKGDDVKTLCGKVVKYEDSRYAITNVTCKACLKTKEVSTILRTPQWLRDRFIAKCSKNKSNASRELRKFMEEYICKRK